MEGRTDRPAGKEVHARPPELARARSGEHEPRSALPRLDLLVHDVEERRRALHLVDHDDLAAGVRRDQLAEPLGAREEEPEGVGGEKVDAQGVRPGLRDPGGFARSAGPEQEEVALRGLE